MSTDIDNDAAHDDIVYPSALPFALVHLGCIAAIWTGVTWQAIGICVALYVIRMFAIGAGYHHLHSDTEQDVHSPRHKGFFYSHLGWMFNRKFDRPDLAKVGDFARYPELMWLYRYEQAPAIIVAGLCLLIAGWSGLVVGFLWSTVLLFHATFCINSLAHVHGKKRYVTGDDSRNNWLLALLTMGEGWHNNHHAYQSSVRQGFKWWEIDPTYYILRGLSWFGLVWDLKTPPDAVLHNEQRLGSKIIKRAAEQLAARFDAEAIAMTVAGPLHGPRLAALRETLSQAHKHTAEVWANVHLPHMPTRDDFRREARAMFARTRSLDDIVDHAYDLLLASVARRLASTAGR
jgi:stearoyl-CoA desaturase (delta-9 desaturase)